MTDATRYTFRAKKVLLFGLGLLGGGVATANWLIKQGAKLTITDLKTEKELVASLKKLKGKYALALGKHTLKDVKAADLVVLNPGVPASHPLLKKAKRVVNEATIFYDAFPGPIIGITGTRGKSTTAAWTAHLIGTGAILAGNSPEHPFLSALPLKLKGESVGVCEMSSFALELFEDFKRKPDIAVITNIYQDHFNRYESYRDYVAAKANIFTHQKANQHVIFNYDNSWTPHLLTLPHSSSDWFFSVSELPAELSGLVAKQGRVYLQRSGRQSEVLDLKGFVTAWGAHNVENFMAAALAAHLSGTSWREVQKRIATLPQIPFRQEVIFENKKITVVNDSNATSPEAVIAAAKRFASPATILITGGTDKKLVFTKWAPLVLQYLAPENIVMLSGTATSKMLRALGAHAKAVTVCDTLAECLVEALQKAKAYHHATLVFSPGAASFEKFANEYDRGRQFSALVKTLLKK